MPRFAKLKTETMGISGGFTYIHHESMVTIGPMLSFQDLVGEVHRYDRFNNYGPTPRELIEQQICKRKPEVCRLATDREMESYTFDPVTMKPIHVKLMDGCTFKRKDVIKATKNLSAWLFSSAIKFTRQKVSPELSEKRASICFDCGNHGQIKDDVSPGCCGGNKLLKIVNAIVGEGQFANYEKLGVCSVCCCLLKAKTQLPLDYLKGLEEELPDNCWIIKESKAENV